MKPRRCGKLSAMYVGEDNVSFASSRSDHNYTLAESVCCLPGLEKNVYILAPLIKNVIGNKLTEGLIVAYPSIRIKERPESEEIKIFIDQLNKMGKFKGLKYTYWYTRRAIKAHGAMECFDDDSATDLLQGYLNCGRMMVTAAKWL
ncbi:hypothetical protein Dsin_024199 [Dipteronia sinensis]|uniref:Uncharacterized protein n=1 Tax=Dipteronia sinensis TaxID=43782 RepID=A0AAE0E1S8_9ROSI|nr:hypothetical protein Dsin_024199 [Dipteronia sinensis]